MHAFPSSEQEKQADRFAEEFLMPEHDIIADLQNLDLAKLVNLKRYWKVSMVALLLRAESLETIPPNQAHALRVQMSKAGYKTREPTELDVLGEKPRLIYELVEAHQKDLGYSFHDLQTIIPLNDEELQRFYLPEQSSASPRLHLVQ